MRLMEMPLDRARPARTCAVVAAMVAAAAHGRAAAVAAQSLAAAAVALGPAVAFRSGLRTH